MPPKSSNGQDLTLAMKLLAALWVVVLFDPQWLLAAHGLRPLLKLPVLLFAAMMPLLALGVPSTPAWSRRWQWYVPFLAFISVGMVTMPFALNNGLARAALTTYLLYWTLIVGTVALVGTARRAEQLLILYGVSFFWWTLWGTRTGMVSWHHTLANLDGYGAFMVGGLGMAYFLAQAAPKGWFRKLMMLTAFLAIVGVVATFARGAFLATVAMFAVIWARSNQKGRTLGFVLVGGVLIVVAASILHPDGAFWAEMKSVFEQGTDEGTGEDRWVLWNTAYRVYLENPIFGTGLRNWGVFAAQFFEPGEVGGKYAMNPRMFYNRSLHSIYFQTLSETGTVGSAFFIWIFVDFWRRNLRLQKKDAEVRWAMLGGRMQLRPIALGLEAGMVAFMVNAAFYSLHNMHWMYTLLGINVLLHALVVRGAPSTKRRRALTPSHPLVPTAGVGPPAAPAFDPTG